MVCKQCGRILKDDALICEFCGKENSVSPHIAGVQGHRQGRKSEGGVEAQPLPVLAQPNVNNAETNAEEKRKPELYVGGSQKRNVQNSQHTHRVHKVMINWMHVAIICASLVILGLGFIIIGLPYTPWGQMWLARNGKDANATALWAYGQELLDQGYIDRAIQTYEKADAKEEEDVYEHLQQLADAYEAAGYARKAEETYYRMIALDKQRMPAYRAIERILTAQDRQMELSAFLMEAYENTENKDFLQKRVELLPATPTTNLEAGTRMYERDVELFSEEGYEILYLLGEEGILPEDGQLYSEPIHLAEGSHVLRAVAINNDLTSDEMLVKYTITLPRPRAPYPSLAPGTYEQRQRVRLKYLESDDEKLQLDYLDDPAARAEAEKHQKDLTMYYTLDGQTPNSNSPVYDYVKNEGILLPSGRVTLKAITVNGYGKVSNVLEREYKINSGTVIRFFRSDDHMADVTLLKTSRDAFVKKYGQPVEETEIEDSTVRGVALKLTYSWGEARFVMVSDGYVLYYLDSTSSSMSGPRNTKIGQKEEAVIAKFRDVGQPHDTNGDRSLYWNGDNNGNDKGKLYHLDDTHDRIDYSYVRTEDSATVTMSYYLENGVVTRMSIRYALQK